MKQITGTFFDIVHHNPGESVHWHDAVIAYREPEWERFMAHMKASGLDTVILIGTVSRGKAMFPDHPFLPTHECLEGFDAVEAALAGADKAGLNINLGLGFQEDYAHEIDNTPEAVARTMKLAETLLARYGDHPSFCAWYIADEFGFTEKGCFNPDPVDYAGEVSAELEKLTPDRPRMISPYFHKNCAVPDPDKLVPQIERMGVHTISVQNGANRPNIKREHFIALRRAFDRVDVQFWGNIELFVFGKKKNPSDRWSPLLPGPFPQICEQMSWVEPYADKLISYQFMGLMNDAGLGKQPEASELWHAYRRAFF